MTFLPMGTENVGLGERSPSRLFPFKGDWEKEGTGRTRNSHRLRPRVVLEVLLLVDKT